MNRRTIIVAMALTIDENGAVPYGLTEVEDIMDYMMSNVEEANVVGVLDREAPVNNVEPQIFTDHYLGGRML